MAGNSERRGAKRNPGSKKGSVVGSGGQRSKALRGKGPTPKATEREHHPAARRARAAAKRSEKPGRPSSPSSRRGGASGGPEYIAGRNAVVEALRAGVPATTLYVAARIDSDDRVKESLQLAVDRGLGLIESGKPELDRLTAGAVHQGVALQVPPYEYAHPDDLVAAAQERGEPPLIVALDGITDPRNLGAIVRSAAAFGAHGVVVPERRAATMTASAWKTSAGAASRLPVARVTNLNRQLAKFRDEGLAVVGLAADADASVVDMPFGDGPIVLVIGAEGEGLSRLVREHCDALASIPMESTTESLNAGVAAGIALFSIAALRG
ncbi:MAG: 23S rRNA (guanosine(2251)-2'-O)-methyltransferase RlmB [Actinomycetes bacterium]